MTVVLEAAMNYCGVDLLAVLSVCVYYGMFTTVRRAGVELCVDVSTRQRQAADVGL